MIESRKYITKDDILTNQKLVDLNIPLSLFINKPQLYLDEINDPTLVKNILEALNFIPVQHSSSKEREKETFFEVYMEIDRLTGNLRVLSKSSTFIVDQIQNYFGTKPGDIPYDPAFGCNIYEYIQTRNLSDSREMLLDDLKQFVNTLRRKSGGNFRLVNVLMENKGKELNITVLIATPDDQIVLNQRIIT